MTIRNLVLFILFWDSVRKVFELPANQLLLTRGWLERYSERIGCMKTCLFLRAISHAMCQSATIQMFSFTIFLQDMVKAIHLVLFPRG